MRINVFTHAKAALIGTPNISDEEREEKLAVVAKCILADLSREFADYVTLAEEEPFVVELELEKAAADQVDICLHYMRMLGLYTAAYFSDGYLGLTQSFNLEI